jgi:hypothetical protein
MAEFAADPYRPDIEHLTPEMNALLLYLSFQITGTEDLPLTAKVLLHYHHAKSPEDTKRPFLVKR